jgi:hypothetical protein
LRTASSRVRTSLELPRREPPVLPVLDRIAALHDRAGSTASASSRLIRTEGAAAPWPLVNRHKPTRGPSLPGHVGEWTSRPQSDRC